MAIYTVQDLKNALGGGAKVDKFLIELGVPAGDPSLTTGTNAPILCKSASFPSKSIGEMSAWIQGRELVLPGNTTYTKEWKLTFYSDAAHEMRKMFIRWMNAIDNFETNFHICDPSKFMVESKVSQLDCNGNPSASYTFFGMFPAEISEVGADSEQMNKLQEFEVTMKYSYWENSL